MTQSQTLKPVEYVAQQQSVIQEHLRALQEDISDAHTAVQESISPQYPNWPTSKPGPWSTPPPPGTKPINLLRSEQVVMIGYDQEMDNPGIPDESIDVQHLRHGKHKERL